MSYGFNNFKKCAHTYQIFYLAGQPANTDMYTQQLQRNSEALREALTESANTIENALLSAQIIAQAIDSRR